MNLDDSRFSSLLTENAPPLINIGTGEDVTIRELAETVARVLGFDGELVFDTGKPDGTPRQAARCGALGMRSAGSIQRPSKRVSDAPGKPWQARLAGAAIPQK